MNDKIAQIKKRGKEDYYYFAKEILGYSKMRPTPHQEMCEFIVSPGKRKKLVLLPRNSFKSSVGTVAGSMFFLLRNPNERILIASETQKIAIKFLKGCRSHYEMNPKFRALYGDWVNETNTWRDNELIVSKRTEIIREPSIMATSLEKQNITGLHFDKIFLDDVVSRSNTNTPEAIEKTLDYYKLLLSILSPDGQIYVFGTRWNYLDLYGWILDPENPENKNFDVYIKPAQADDGTLLMPDVLSEQFLIDQKATQGESIFNHQYLLKPTSTEEQTFKPEWVKFYERAPKGLYYFMSIDPAISQEADADYTGIIVNGCDHKHDWYIHEAIGERLQPSDILNYIFLFAEKYKPMMCLGLEKFMLEKLLLISLQEEMIKRNVIIPIREVQTDNRVSKEHRIRALQPRFQNGQIFLLKKHKKLFHEIVMHPQIAHDDLIDALKTQLPITFPGEYVEPESDLSHLTYREIEIWDEVRELGKRRVVERSF